MPQRWGKNKTAKRRKVKRKTRRGGGVINNNSNSNNNLNLTAIVGPAGLAGLKMPKPVRRPKTPTYEPETVPENWKTPRNQNKYKVIAVNEVFPEKPDVCPPLFTVEKNAEDVKPVVYPFLTKEAVEDKKTLKVGQNYIFAIKVSEPKKIYYYEDEAFLYPHRTEEELQAIFEVLETKARSNWVTNRGWSRRVTHNCLTNNEDAICAGDFILTNSKHVTINNNSGHFYPKGECLNYVKSLFLDLGFAKVDVNALYLEE